MDVSDSLGSEIDVVNEEGQEDTADSKKSSNGLLSNSSVKSSKKKQATKKDLGADEEEVTDEHADISCGGNTSDDLKEETNRRKRSKETASGSAGSKKSRSGTTTKGQQTSVKTKRNRIDSSASNQSVSQKATSTIFVRLPPKVKFEAAKIEACLLSQGFKTFKVREIKGRNFGFVDLSDASLVPKALELNGYRLDGVEMLVELANEKPEYVPKPSKAELRAKLRAEEETRKLQIEEEANRTKLVIKNLPLNISEKILLDHFPQATEIRLPVDADNKYKGFGYIEFKTEEAADEVLATMQGSMLCGQAIVLDYVGEKSLNGLQSQNQLEDPTRTLFVKHLSPDLTEDVIKKAFASSTSVRLVSTSNSVKPRSYAFVSYDTPELAHADREAMNGKKLNGRTIIVDLAVQTRDNTKNKLPKSSGSKKKIKVLGEVQSPAGSSSESTDSTSSAKCKLKTDKAAKQKVPKDEIKNVKQKIESKTNEEQPVLKKSKKTRDDKKSSVSARSRTD